MGLHRILGRPPDHLPAQVARTRREARCRQPSRSARARHLRLRQRPLPHPRLPQPGGRSERHRGLRPSLGENDQDPGQEARRRRQAPPRRARAGHPRESRGETSRPAAGQVDQLRARRGHLAQHPTAGMERREQRAGRTRGLRGHASLHPPLPCLPANLLRRLARRDGARFRRHCHLAPRHLLDPPEERQSFAR